jgi:RimJ/RimL family protein N-acetyltransferase
MAFGHWMEVVDGDVRLRLGPIRREDVGRYVAADAGYGLQSYEVTRYLGVTFAPTPQGEEEWWDAAAKTDGHLHWGIYLPDDNREDGDGWSLVGTTTLHLPADASRQAVSGFLLFDRAHWRQRVATVAHLARTYFAFHELDLLAIRSHVADPNVGSKRALARIGYVQTGTVYSESFADGEPVDGIEYLLPNPTEPAWRYFWRRPDDEIPAPFLEARVRTTEALERAASAVTFL